MNAEDLAARGFPDTNWADYNLDDLDTCLSDLRSSRETHNLHLVYVKPSNLQPINVLIIWISGSSDERSQAVTYFTQLINDRTLDENEGIHSHGDSYIVIPDSPHWSDKLHQLEGATLKLRSNETYAFDYSLVYDDGTVETNTKVAVALPETEMGDAAEDERVDNRASQSCYNKQNRSKGAGCPVNKGLGYSSGHNCKSIFKGKMYSCEIRCPDGEGGEYCFTEECIKVNQAGGLEGGYCYN